MPTLQLFILGDMDSFGPCGVGPLWIRLVAAYPEQTQRRKSMEVGVSTLYCVVRQVFL